MEYSLRNKSTSPPFRRLRKLLNRNVTATKVSPEKSKISIKKNKQSQATSETENAESSAVLSKDDTIGKRLCRRRSTAGNFGNVSISKAKGKLGRKSCLARISVKPEVELEESPAENIALKTVNVPVVEDTCKSEVDGDVCETQPSDGDTVSPKTKSRRSRKSCFENIALIPESEGEESIAEAIPSENLVVDTASKKCEKVRGERQTSGGETVASKGKGKSGRRSCIAGIVLEDGKKGLQDCENKVFECQSCDEVSESSAGRTKRRLVRESKECENMEICQTKVTRSSRKRRISDACNETAAIPDHVSNETELKVTNIDSESASISSPKNVDSLNQTENNLSSSNISSWEVTDSKDVAVESSKTYSSLCKTKATQCSVGFKSRSTQSTVPEMVHKGTSTEDINSSQEGDLMVLILESVKKIREHRHELLISSATNPPLENSVIKDMISPSELSKEGEKLRDSSKKKRRFSSGSKYKEKSETKTETVISQSSAVPISFTVQVKRPIASKSVASDKPVIDDSIRSPISVEDVLDNKKKLSHSKHELLLKDHDQPRDGRIEKKKLIRLSRKDVDKSPILCSLSGKKEKATNEQDGNVKPPADKQKTVKKVCDTSGDSSVSKSDVSITVAVEERVDISANKKDSQQEKSEKKGNVPACNSSVVKMHPVSPPLRNVQRSKITSRGRTDSGSDEKVSSSTSDHIQKDTTVSSTNQKNISLNEKEDKVVLDVTRRAEMTSSPIPRRSSIEKTVTSNVTGRAEVTPSPIPRRSSIERTVTSNLTGRAEMTPSPIPRRSSIERTVTSNLTKRSDMTTTPASRRSSPDEKTEKLGALNLVKRTEMTPSPTPKMSSSVEKVDKTVSSNTTKRTELTASLIADSPLSKLSKSLGIVEAPTAKNSAADVFVKPNPIISRKEKRSSGKGVSEELEETQKVGNTSRFSPLISQRILKHQRKSGPSPTASATNLRRKSSGEKDEKGERSHKGEMKGDSVEKGVSTGPDSSTVDGMVLDVKQEITDYCYSKDEDDDVLSLYPESEYAEMFGSLDNHLSNVSDTYVEDRCPSASMDTETNDNSMTCELPENDMEESIQKENEKKDEDHPCTENVSPEEIVASETDAGNVNDSTKPRENLKLMAEDQTDVNAVRDNVEETLPVTSEVSIEQKLDSKNDIQTAENIDESGESLSAHLSEEKELNFTTTDQISEEIKEMPKEVDVKVESDAVILKQQKQSVELVTSSLEVDGESSSACEEVQNRPSTSTITSTPAETDNSSKTNVKERIGSKAPVIFRGICYNFMKGKCCRCPKFSHSFPVAFMTKMENANSSDIYSALMFAVQRRLERLLDDYGEAFASILSSRKEGNLLMPFLMEYVNEFKGSASFWDTTLRLIIDCGNCCETSSVKVVMFITEHILTDYGLSFKLYHSLLEKIISIVCEFKDINYIRQVLDSLEFDGTLLQGSTVRKLLKLLLLTLSDIDKSRISYTVAHALSVAKCPRLSNEDLKLFRIMTEALKRNGHEGLLKQLESKYSIVSNDLTPQKVSDVAHLAKVNEKRNEGTPRKQDFPKLVGSKSQKNKFIRNLETESNMQVPSKRARMSFDSSALQKEKRRENFNNFYSAGNDPQWNQGSGDIYSQPPENRHLNVDYQPSSSSMLSAFPSWSPVHRYGPNDDSERDRRDFEAAFTAPLSSPLPMSAHGRTLFPQGARSKLNDPVNKSLPSTSSNEPGVRFRHSALKKENPSYGKQSFLLNAPSGVPELIPGRSISPSVRKGFSKFGDVSAEAMQFRNCGSPVMRNTPSTSSSRSSTGSVVEQNFLEQPSSSSAISLSLLQKKPDSSSQKVLEEAFRKSKWSPNLVLSAFSPWLNSPKQQIQLSQISCKILEQDYTKAAVSLKSLLHCLGSQALRSNKKFDDIKKILSTVIFNLILRMVISDVWSDAYKFLKMASSASLPIFLAEAFIEEEMSISRKCLVLSEVCFRVNAMDEAIGYLHKGKLFGPVSSWQYPHLYGDLEIQVTFLSSLLNKLASGGFSETAPSIFLTICESQKSLYKPVDLSAHVNKVILCALNGSCIKQAYEVYMTISVSAVRLPKTTYRALLIGLVSAQKYLLARNLFLQISGLGIYPGLKENEIQHEITIYSYWQKEEIFIILDNALRVIYDNEVKINPNKEILDLEMNIHIEVSDIPEDLSVPWRPLKDDGSEDQEPIPHSLALISNSLEEAHDRVTFVLEQMFAPPILYDSIVTKEELEELLTLHPESLATHIYERFFCESGFCE